MLVRILAAAVGLPLLLAALIFGAVGVGLLIVTRDSLVQVIARKLRRK